MRHAIYFAPAAGSALEAHAAAWLGRDLAGAPVARPAVPGLSAERHEALTAAPRHYGFHATLKPPFRLAAGTTEADLIGRLEAFATARRAVTVAAPAVEALGPFLALRSDAPELAELAGACVEAFDGFRAPAPPEETAARRAKGLTPRQDALLQRWGYPYVFDEFRFHMTLTEPVPDPAERESLRAWLADWLAPALSEPLTVAEVALYTQPDRARPFVLTRRFPFGG